MKKFEINNQNQIQNENCICDNCAKCCFETEMELSNEDIARIERLNPWGLKKHDFCIYLESFYVLKNINGHCIFLNDKNLKCKIYEYRPTGCKFYPLMYDLNKDKCKMDSLCPKRHEFYPDLTKIKIYCNELKKWIQNELYISK